MGRSRTSRHGQIALPLIFLGKLVLSLIMGSEHTVQVIAQLKLWYLSYRIWQFRKVASQRFLRWAVTPQFKKKNYFWTVNCLKNIAL